MTGSVRSQQIAFVTTVRELNIDRIQPQGQGMPNKNKDKDGNHLDDRVCEVARREGLREVLLDAVAGDLCRLRDL